MSIHSVKNKKLGLIIWGLALIFAAVWLILDSTGVIAVDGGFSWWRILLGVLLGAWLVAVCIKLRFTDIFFPLAFLFLVFEGPIATALGKEDLINNWIILLAALLLTVGTKIVFSKHGVVHISSGDTVSKNENVQGKLGNSTVYFDAADIDAQKISDNLGKVDVFFTNKEQYPGSGVLTICDNLGVVTLHLPKEWDVMTQTSDNLGRVFIPEKDVPGEKTITLVITDNLGKIDVVYE